MVKIIKASGIKEPFSKSKIQKSIQKAGAPAKIARKVANKVAKKVKEGTKTEDILKLTIKELKIAPEIAARYDLKRAIMNLGPSGFPFEEYFSQVLRLKNY